MYISIILNLALEGGDSWVVLPLVPNLLEAGWAPEPVSTLWSRKKNLTSGGNQTPAHLSSTP
jgi:hypothetical protein